jgi:hypothetical protein
MAWNLEYTDEFQAWWDSLSETEQESAMAISQLLAERGPQLPHPYSSQINGSKHGHMRELRIQCQGRPIRIFYAFNPERTAILLIGGDKTGNDRFYEQMIPIADALYDVHLKELKAEQAKESKQAEPGKKAKKAKPKNMARNKTRK